MAKRKRLGNFGPDHARLLDDADIKRWHSNVSQGSLITADVYLRQVDNFCIRTKTTPKGILALDVERLHHLLLDYVADEQKKGRAGSYIHSIVKSVKSWLLHNGIEIRRPIKVRGASGAPTLRDEGVPTQEELRQVFLAASSRDRVAAVLMAHSGVRPAVIGNYAGVDGLRLGDLPDLKIKGTSVDFEVMPARIIVRSELSKVDHQYFTFIGEEGCSYIKSYLEDRVQRGVKLEPDLDLVAPKWDDKHFIKTTNIGDAIRAPIRAAGFDWRPYVLRAYFDTQLLLAESKGKIAHDYRVFWMGHKGSMEARYTTNKGRLPKEMIEDMREAYKRCEPFLSTVATKAQVDAASNPARVMLVGLGYQEDELKGIDFAHLDPKLFREMVKKKMDDAPRQSQTQQIVDISELPEFLKERWTVVMPLNGTKVVLNPPAS